MIPPDSRFEADPERVVGDLVDDLPHLPDGWTVDAPDPDDRADLEDLVALLRDHERHGRGWAGASVDDVLVEVSPSGLRTREHVVVRDGDGRVRAWGGVHDRAGGRMVLRHVVGRGLDEAVGRACSDLLVGWAVGQAVAVGRARGLGVQLVDTDVFAGDERQARWLAGSGFTRVRTWWHMTRPVTPDERDLVPSVEAWEGRGVRFRQVGRAADGMPDEADLRAVHAVLEEAFRDHFNSRTETFEEFSHRLREDPGHRWDHWWLAELSDGPAPRPVGALVGTVSAAAPGSGGPDGSYVAYLGVLEVARGRGVARGLLRTVVADAALRGRDRVGLEVDADPAGASEMYLALGWRTAYVTESWHRDVPVD